VGLAGIAAPGSKVAGHTVEVIDALHAATHGSGVEAVVGKARGGGLADRASRHVARNASSTAVRVEARLALEAGRWIPGVANHAVRAARGAQRCRWVRVEAILASGTPAGVVLAVDAVGISAGCESAVVVVVNRAGECGPRDAGAFAGNASGGDRVVDHSRDTCRAARRKASGAVGSARNTSGDGGIQVRAAWATEGRVRADEWAPRAASESGRSLASCGSSRAVSRARHVGAVRSSPGAENAIEGSRRHVSIVANKVVGSPMRLRVIDGVTDVIEVLKMRRVSGHKGERPTAVGNAYAKTIGSVAGQTWPTHASAVSSTVLSID
jgi:hypothetical protein